MPSIHEIAIGMVALYAFCWTVFVVVMLTWIAEDVRRLVAPESPRSRPAALMGTSSPDPDND